MVEGQLVVRMVHLAVMMVHMVVQDGSVGSTEGTVLGCRRYFQLVQRLRSRAQWTLTHQAPADEKQF